MKIESGWLAGNAIRRARKPGRCNYWHGKTIGRCKHLIAVGELYAEGEPNDEAGGWARDRYCLECAGEEARATAAAAESREG